MKGFILAVDQGTTSTRAVVLTTQLEVVATASHEIPQIYPKPGLVEHDPKAIWNSCVLSIKDAIGKSPFEAKDCLAIGITNQRETTIVWDAKDGKPVHNAIVWQCRRTAPLCEEMKKQGLEPLFRQKTGLVLDPYFSGTKLKWLLDNVHGLRTKAEQGKVKFGTVDSFLIYRLTGGKVHVTDSSNASRTLLLNIETLEWDEELLKVLQIPRPVLPEVKPSAGVFGLTKDLGFLPDGIPIAGVAGDQQAALFGQACYEDAQSKCTYGTGAFLLMNTGTRRIRSKHGLLTTIAWTVDNITTYALEGSVFIAGAAVQWLRDGLGLIKKASEIEVLARTVEDNGGVVFVPALAGMGAPYWSAEARGAFFGLSRATTAGNIARAVLEGIAFSVAVVTEAMEMDAGFSLSELKVDGGASANNLLLEFQSDLLGVPVVRPKVLETTARGASALAGLGASIISMEGLKKLFKEDKRFEPSWKEDQRKKTLERFKKAVEATIGFDSDR
jgi:glycerol kinase